MNELFSREPAAPFERGCVRKRVSFWRETKNLQSVAAVDDKLRDLRQFIQLSLNFFILVLEKSSQERYLE
jgi:hypothetical protein